MKTIVAAVAASLLGAPLAGAFTAQSIDSVKGTGSDVITSRAILASDTVLRGDWPTRSMPGRPFSTAPVDSQQLERR